ncbi:MAG: ADP-ribosylglycohydrolase family protein [Erysipelotrichaceae bacterium]|nr:ADP-ribosylglycohydrolase family protein [Erysipelotrichaceae bacterium]
MNDKIYGSLLAAALGDAMGAATETRSIEQIKEKFGGLVTEILPIPEDVFARGMPLGSVTDDFSLAYETAKAIVDHKGDVDRFCAEDALLNWSKTKYYKMAGPTTVAAVERLKGNILPNPYDFLTVDNSKGSNGSAMKISPAGLVSKGNIDTAVRNAVTICMPTHANSASLAGACAVSAAIAAALKEDADLDKVFEAGLYGAMHGEEIGIKLGKRLATPSIPKRMILAREIALKRKDDMEACLKELTDILGSGLAAAEAVPCAFGILFLTGGDPLQAVIGGVNIGNDTDTVATIAGSIAGALNGSAAIPEEFAELIEQANGFDLKKLAEDLERVAHE